MSKLTQFILRHEVQNGYSVVCAVEQIAVFCRISREEILTAALNDERAAQYLLNLARRLAA